MESGAALAKAGSSRAFSGSRLTWGSTVSGRDNLYQTLSELVTNVSYSPLLWADPPPQNSDVT